VTICWSRPQPGSLLSWTRWRAHRLSAPPSGLSVPRPGPGTPAGKAFLASADCLALTPLAVSLHLAAASAGSSWAWQTFVAGVVIGALTIVTAVVIAWRQRVIQLRDRAEERRREGARQREHEAQEAKIARREMWRAEYEAIRELLECGEKLAYHVRNDGPFTAARFAALDVATFRMNGERLAERGVPHLRDPLFQLAGKVDELVQAAVPDETALTAAYSRSQVPADMRLHRVNRQAILQDRAARGLAELIASTWQVLRMEWGS
jgi:hypothetical protein